MDAGVSEMGTDKMLGVDVPIKIPEHDVLDRVALASVIAERIRKVNASDGHVMALLGPWGSGKTSLLNLIERELEGSGDIAIVHFNPWMFSGSVALVDVFFREVAAQLGTRTDDFKRFGAELSNYGELLFGAFAVLPGVGAWASRVQSQLINFRSARKLREKQLQEESVFTRHIKLSEQLDKMQGRIVVIVDDIDRLQNGEIRDIFKLVRLTGNFPNVIYILSFDRYRVETALGDSSVGGRQFLEKIVQTAIDVPVAPSAAIISQITSGLDKLFDEESISIRFDQPRWPDVFSEIILPLMRNLRDVKRFLLGLENTLRHVGAEVDTVDVLALEAIRIFLPDVFEKVIQEQVALTTPSPLDHQRVRFAEQVQSVINAAGVEAEEPERARNIGITEALIPRVFMGGARNSVGTYSYGQGSLSKWLRGRRVAHPAILRFYLEKSASSEFKNYTDAEIVFFLLPNPIALKDFLLSLSPSRLQDVIAALEIFEEDFPANAVVSGATVILNLAQDLEEKPRQQFFEIQSSMVVARVILRMLRKLPSQTEIEYAVGLILPGLTTLSARLQLVLLAGHAEHVGANLVSEKFIGYYQEELLKDIRRANVDELITERELNKLLLAPTFFDATPASILTTYDNPFLNVAILNGAKQFTARQAMDSRHFDTEPVLNWAGLKAIYGSEQALHEMRHSLNRPEVLGLVSDDTLELFDRYMSDSRQDELVIEE
jgi:hypothetical protein